MKEFPVATTSRRQVWRAGNLHPVGSGKLIRLLEPEGQPGDGVEHDNDVIAVAQDRDNAEHEAAIVPRIGVSTELVTVTDAVVIGVSVGIIDVIKNLPLIGHS